MSPPVLIAGRWSVSAAAKFNAKYGSARSRSRCFSSTDNNNNNTAVNYRVGFIGLGNMGLPMALNLMSQTNVSVLAYDTNQDVMKANCGWPRMEMADSIHEIATFAAARDDGLDAIFTMLPSCAAVDAVMGQLKEGLNTTKDMARSKPQTTTSRCCFVDCSTVNPATSRHWYDVWKAAGHSMFDAPVSGGVKGATAGTLTFMVGSEKGDDESVLEGVVRPLLQCMGQNVVWCGGPGAGSATKLCNNLALAAQMVGICEALNLGERLGVDPVILTQVMNTSTAACWSSKVNNPHPAVALSMMKASGCEGPPASRDYQGGFGAKLMLKDLGLAVAVAEECGVATPLTSTTQALYQSATSKGLGDKDFGVILEYLKTSK